MNEQLLDEKANGGNELNINEVLSNTLTLKNTAIFV
jgi:hypothetical protein